MSFDRWLVRKILWAFIHRYVDSYSNSAELNALRQRLEWARLRALHDSLGGHGVNVRLREGVRIVQPEKVYIGSHVEIGENCFLMGQGGLHIGSYSLLATGCVLVTANHAQDGGLFYDRPEYTPVKLGENVWLGAGVIVLPSVQIGDHAIIGAGAVVTKDIPAHSVAVGVPARVVRPFATDEALLASQKQALAARYGA